MLRIVPRFGTRGIGLIPISNPFSYLRIVTTARPPGGSGVRTNPRSVLQDFDPGNWAELSGDKTRSVFERYVIEDTKRRRETLGSRGDLFRAGLADKGIETADKIAEFLSVSEESGVFDSHTLPPT